MPNKTFYEIHMALCTPAFDLTETEFASALQDHIQRLVGVEIAAIECTDVSASVERLIRVLEETGLPAWPLEVGIRDDA